MKCPSCGVDFDEKSVYCPACGERADIAAESDPNMRTPPLDGHASPKPVEDEPAPEVPAEEKAPAPAARSDSTQNAKERMLDIGHNSADKEYAALPWTQGGYSGKAMRGHFLGAFLLTGLFIALGVWLTGQTWIESTTAKQITWCVVLAPPLALFVYIGCIFIYRTWTIKYRLSDYRFYHEKGFLRRTKDVIEVIDIADMKQEQSLMDKLINGGVGTVIILSTDTTTPELKLIGLADYEACFDAIDESRRRQRTERGLKSI